MATFTSVGEVFTRQVIFSGHFLGSFSRVIPRVILKVSYFIKKRGWHENQSDGTRHKQRESTVYNRVWNQLEATRGGR
mgnify:CR=1 FL=1